MNRSLSLKIRSRKRVLVTGGCGFIGSHLCTRLIENNCDVLCLDNLYSGDKENIAHLMTSPYFEFARHDVTFPFYAEVDEIYNLLAQHRPFTTNMILCRPRRPACMARSICWAWQSAQAQRSFKPQQVRSMVTQKYIRRQKTTGAASIQSAFVAAMTKANVAPRLCLWTTTGNMASK